MIEINKNVFCLYLTFKREVEREAHEQATTKEAQRKAFIIRGRGRIIRLPGVLWSLPNRTAYLHFTMFASIERID